MCVCLISNEKWYTSTCICSNCRKYAYSTTYFLSDLSACITCRCVLQLHDKKRCIIITTHETLYSLREDKEVWITAVQEYLI